jgi:hypothetical protein
LRQLQESLFKNFSFGTDKLRKAGSLGFNGRSAFLVRFFESQKQNSLEFCFWLSQFHHRKQSLRALPVL